MAFYAGKHINVERDGKLVMLNPGDPCPEAATYDADVLQRLMQVGQVVDLEAPPKPHVKGRLVKQKATNESLARASATREVAEARKPLSTHEAAHGKKTTNKSSADAARAARKGAAQEPIVSTPAATHKSKKVTREIDGMQIPVRQAPKRIAPARKAG